VARLKPEMAWGWPRFKETSRRTLPSTKIFKNIISFAGELLNRLSKCLGEDVEEQKEQPHAE
jgi:hypothetical protein